MLKIIAKILIIGELMLLPIGSVWGDVAPTSKWTTFYGSTTAYNGSPIPIGSIIDAYDFRGIHCGRDTVIMTGHYGFMPVYGEDGFGEGAQDSAAITFYVNNRLAIPHGPDDPIWLGMDYRLEVNLSASASISMAPGAMPGDQIAYPGDTIRYYVTVQNTGQGLDFYTIFGTSEHGWIIRPMSGFGYALPDSMAALYFDVLIPQAIFHGVDDQVTFRVSSGIDPSVFVEASAVTHVQMQTDVEDDDKTILPGRFELFQNYPNPFNPVTNISFNLPARSIVVFEAFNLLGQTVSYQNLGSLDAGRHLFEFDGEALPSGIYFYRITAGESYDTRKMILMK